jgi:hypothetical protein
MGDAEFPKLHALCDRREIRNKYFFAQIHHLIRMPTKDVKRSEILDKLEMFNRDFEILGKGPTYSEKPLLDFKKQRPPYEVRTALDTLYHVLDSSWKMSCKDHSHEAKLRLSTFGRSCPPDLKEEEDSTSHDIDMLFLTHPPSLRWRQSQVRIIEG